jgi:hypothetical protein
MRPGYLLIGGFLAVVVQFVAGKPPEPPPYSAERDQSARAFVKDHHVELLEVLERLATLDREQYEQAIRQISAEADRLALVKLRDDKLYELMLESWQVQSRIDLLAARLAVTRGERTALEADLRKLLYRGIDLHRTIIEHNRERALASLKTMETNIQLLTDKREELVAKRFQNLTGIKKPAPAVPAAPDAKKKPATPDKE